MWLQPGSTSGEAPQVVAFGPLSLDMCSQRVLPLSLEIGCIWLLPQCPSLSASVQVPLLKQWANISLWAHFLPCTLTCSASYLFLIASEGGRWSHLPHSFLLCVFVCAHMQEELKG